MLIIWIPKTSPLAITLPLTFLVWADISEEKKINNKKNNILNACHYQLLKILDFFDTALLKTLVLYHNLRV